MESKNSEQTKLDTNHGEYNKVNVDNVKENENHSNTEIKVYSLRWWIGLFYVLQIILIRINMNSFGVVNNVYKAYFNISYYAVDWFVLTQTFGLLISTVVLIFLILSETVGFRKLFIMMITCTIASYFFSMLAFSYPLLLPLMYIGEFTIGVGFQASTAIFSTFATSWFATSWFPEHQVGIALSAKTLSMCTGCLFAYFIPSQLVPPPPPSLIELDNNTELTAVCNGSMVATENTNWFHEIRWKFLYLYGGLVSGCVLVCFFAIFFVTDEPPKPPSMAQALRRTKRYEDHTKIRFVGFNKFWIECKSILTNKTVIYYTVILIKMFSCNYMEKVLMGEISREVFVSYKRK